MSDTGSILKVDQAQDQSSDQTSIYTLSDDALRYEALDLVDEVDGLCLSSSGADGGGDLSHSGLGLQLFLEEPDGASARVFFGNPSDKDLTEVMGHARLAASRLSQAEQENEPVLNPKLESVIIPFRRRKT